VVGDLPNRASHRQPVLDRSGPLDQSRRYPLPDALREQIAAWAARPDRYEDEAQKAEGARLFAEVKALMPSHIYLEWRPYRLRLPGHARSERPTE